MAKTLRYQLVLIYDILKMSRLGVLVLLVACMIVVNTMPAKAGVTHTHKHEKHNSKERLKDGIYAARDAHHLEDGEHNVEFDHEAIIGEQIKILHLIIKIYVFFQKCSSFLAKFPSSTANCNNTHDLYTHIAI